MFCPKCGIKNPETGKFCRGCGADIGNVMNALAKSPESNASDELWGELGFDCSEGTIEKKKRRSNPDEVFVDGIRNSIFGLGFLIASASLFITGVAGGKNWWWAMMIPAFVFISQGVADLVKSKRMRPSVTSSLHGASTNTITNSLNNAETNYLPQNYTEPASVESKYRTGELVPPSVTDNTTKLLDKELSK